MKSKSISLSRLKKSIITAAVFCGTLSLNADTITFKDGRSIIGKITNQSRTSITFLSDSGTNTYPKSEIKRIAYDNLWEEKKKRDAEEQERLKTEKEQEKLRKENEDKARQNEAKEKSRKEKAEEEEKVRRELEAKEAADVERRAEDLQNKLKQKRAAILFREDSIWAYMHQDYQVGPRENKENNAPPVAVVEDAGYSSGKWGMLKRNSVLPGWGYFYGGKKEYGYAGAGLFGAVLVNSIMARSAFAQAESTYNSQSMTYTIMALAGANSNPIASLLVGQSLDNSAFATYDKAAKSFNNSISLLGIIYATIVIHSYLIDPYRTAGKEDQTAETESYKPRFSLLMTSSQPEEGSFSRPSMKINDPGFIAGSVSFKF